MIDWFTVIAQLVNFAILVVALKFLLYDRVIGAMEKRRSALVERETTARDREREAAQELARLRGQQRDLDEQRDEVLEDARRRGDHLLRQLLDQARSDVDRQEQEWRESLRNNQDRLLVDLQRLTGQKAVTISRRLLADMADRSLEEAVISGLARRIDELPEEDRRAIATTVAENDAPIVVRSAFELSTAGREQVTAVVTALAGDRDRPITWEQDHDLIGGVVVLVGDRSVGWSVAHYLDEVGRGFAELLGPEGAPAEQERDG